MVNTHVVAVIEATPSISVELTARALSGREKLYVGNCIFPELIIVYI